MAIQNFMYKLIHLAYETIVLLDTFFYYRLTQLKHLFLVDY